MIIRRYTRLLLATVAIASVTSLHAETLVDNIPFTVNSGPFMQTEALPQFNPALGTLTNANITLSGSLQDVAEIVNSGPAMFDVTLQNFINVGSLQAQKNFPLGGFIPANTPVLGVQLPVTPFSVSTSLNGQLAEFTGPGSLSFLLQVPNPITQIVEGTTVSSVFGSVSVDGNIALDYTYTPAAAVTPSAVPEPSPAVLLLTGLLLMTAGCLRRVRGRYSTHCDPMSRQSGM